MRVIAHLGYMHTVLISNSELVDLITGIQLESVLHTIRRAALEPSLWPEVQVQTAAYIGAPTAQIAVAEHSGSRRFSSRTTGLPELDKELPDWAPSSEVVAYAASNPNWRHIVDYDYIDEADIARSPFYAFNQRFDLKYRMLLRLADTPGRSEAILWAWPGSHGHPQARHLERLHHIEEALRASAFVCSSRCKAGSCDGEYANLLESLDCPAFIVDACGFLENANALGQKFLGGNAALFLDDGILSPRSHSTRRQFRKLLADCGHQTSLGRPARLMPSMRLNDPISCSNHTVRAVPLAKRGHFLHPANPQVLVMVIQHATSGIPIAALADEHNLTEAECDVLKHFCSALPLQEISRLRGVSTETVRRQMKTIMSKFGVSRQAELALAVASFRQL